MGGITRILVALGLLTMLNTLSDEHHITNYTDFYAGVAFTLIGAALIWTVFSNMGR